MKKQNKQELPIHEINSMKIKGIAVEKLSLIPVEIPLGLLLKDMKLGFRVIMSLICNTDFKGTSEKWHLFWQLEIDFSCSFFKLNKTIRTVVIQKQL